MSIDRVTIDTWFDSRTPWPTLASVAPTGGGPPPPTADVLITISATTQVVSQLETGVTHANTALMYGNAAAEVRARRLLAPALEWHNVFMQGWGPSRIWPWDDAGALPEPTTPVAGVRVGGVPEDGKVDFISQEINSDNAVLPLDAGMAGQLMFSFFRIPYFLREKTTWTSGSIAGGNLIQAHVPVDQSNDNTGSPTDSTAADKGRIYAHKVSKWKALVTFVAKHFMAPPYNCRCFQSVLQEWKGLQSRARDVVGQAWDVDNYRGTLATDAYGDGHNSGDMGAVYAHRITADAILDAADQSVPPIPRANIKIGGPYIPLRAITHYVGAGVTTADRCLGPTSTPTAQPENADIFDRSWGYMQRGGVDAFNGRVTGSTYDGWLKIMHDNAYRLDFVSFDFGGAANKGDTATQPSDPTKTYIVQDDHDDCRRIYNMFTDVVHWLKGIMTTWGYGSLPICISEVYTNPELRVAGQTQIRKATRAVSYIAMIEQGVWLPLIWGVDGESEPDDAMVFDTTASSGGYAMPVLDVVQIIHDNFSVQATPSTRRNIKALTYSIPNVVYALANPTNCLLVNGVNGIKTVSINGGAVITLAPFDVQLVSY